MDRQRVDALFRDHARDVLAYAMRRADRVTAEEVVSEVFVVAWRRADRIPHEDPVLWLYAIARRLLANERRATGRREALRGVLRAIASTPDSEAFDGASLLDALAQLRAADREVLMLVAWEGLDARQAATVLGCTPQAVHKRLSRARRRLASQAVRIGVPVPRMSAEVKVP